MLERIRIQGFKSLEDVSVELPRLAVLFGPNASGKSNFLDSLHYVAGVLTKFGPEEMFSEPLRGHPYEQVSLPPGGIKELLRQPEALTQFSMAIAVPDQLLALKLSGRLEIDLKVKFLPKAARVSADFSINPVSRKEDIHAVKALFNGWNIYYLEPRLRMRESALQANVHDLGPSGEHLLAFLYALQIERKKDFQALVNNVRALIPTIEDLSVNLNEDEGTLNLQIIQDGTPYSYRIISEGTLRVIALCSIAFNPWSGSLVGIEEPENGVSPRRLEMVINLLKFMAFTKGQQVIITTHSPQLITMMNRMALADDNIGLFVCRREFRRTVIRRFKPVTGLDEDEEIRAALETDKEDQLFEAMLMRGWIDG